MSIVKPFRGLRRDHRGRKPNHERSRHQQRRRLCEPGQRKPDRADHPQTGIQDR